MELGLTCQNQLAPQGQRNAITAIRGRTTILQCLLVDMALIPAGAMSLVPACWLFSAVVSIGNVFEKL
jgi:hypothetical protein